MIVNIAKEIEHALDYMHNDTEEALNIFNKILEIDPDNIRALNGKASTLMKLKRMDEAEEYFKKSLALNKNTSALINLGIISKNKAQYVDALNYFDEAIQIKPQLGSIITQFKEEIISNFKADELNSHILTFNAKANNLIIQGLKNEKSGNYWDAIDYYERAIGEDSSSKDVLGAMICKLNENIQDEFLYEDKTSENIINNPFKIKVARAFLIEKRPKKAAKIIDTLLSENPQDVTILNYKGGLEFSFDNYEESIKYFDKCIELNPDYYYAIFNKGLLLRRLKRYQDALSCFEDGLEKPELYNRIKKHHSAILEKMVDQSPS